MSTVEASTFKNPSSPSDQIVLNTDGSIAGDLGDALASKLPYAFGTATPTTTDEGFLWYDSNDTPPAPKFWDGAAFQALTSGKILQVVRETDSTLRSTTSTTLVDANLSVTITPQKEDSAVLVVWNLLGTITAANVGLLLTITDNSNNALSGAEFSNNFGVNSAITGQITLIGYSTPATTSATTYKGRFRRDGGSGTAELRNQVNTGQMYAIEVSA